MSYVAPDGNTYKYKISGQGSSDGNYSMDIYSNPRICLLNVSGDYRAIGLNSDNTACGWITAISGSHASRITGAMYPSTVSNDSCLSIIYYTNGSTSGIGGNWSGKYNVTYNSNIYVASSMKDAYAYLTAPEVFQIPSFSFSGSIIPGQNSSLSQGSCSLASPYTTSFSFEGKTRELVSLKKLFYDKTGYIVTDDLVNQTKSYMETHQQHQIYWIGGHDLNGHYGFHVFVCAPGSYFESNAGQGGQLYYKAPTKRWYWNVDSTTHKSVTTLNTYWDFNSDGSSFQIWNTYTFGIVGGYNDYDY